MKIYIVGNELVKEDSMPFRLLSDLQKAFPSFVFEEADPNENFTPEEGSIIIDTVQGINDVTLFTSLDAFESATNVSAHDYDLLFHLRLLIKLKKLSRVRVLGIPMDMKQSAAKSQVVAILRHYFVDRK
jgi:Ni,Fe-hydrogenase maturation factor